MNEEVETVVFVVSRLTTTSSKIFVGMLAKKLGVRYSTLG